MTKKDAKAIFDEFVKPFIPLLPGGSLDTIWLAEEWNNFTDALMKDKEITAHQYDTWACPY